MPVGDSPIRTSLASVYGHSKRHLDGQIERYTSAMSTFSALAGAGPVSIFRAPGRVNLIGEHTDYNQGYVLPMALDKDTVLMARPRADNTVRLWNIEAGTFGERSFAISDGIPAWPLGDWGNYIKAAAQALYVHNHAVLRGMDALIVGAAPWGTPRAAGLSSSSALLVTAAMALATLNQISIEKVSFARMCSEAEWYVGTRGGIMDHFISILAQRGHALLLDCRPQVDAQTGHMRYTMEHVSIPDGYRVLICNSGVARQKTRSKYNVRVAECRLAVTLLQACYPRITHLRDVSAAGLSMDHSRVMELVASLPERVEMRDVQRQPALAATLQTLNSQMAADEVFMVRARARHVVSENARVLEAVAALRLGNAPAFGRLMNEAHDSMSGDYGASCPEVDALAAIARRTPGVLGARVTGAGWGGCVVALAEDSDLGIEQSVAEQYLATTGLATSIFVCRSAPGAGRSRSRVVILAASLMCADYWNLGAQIAELEAAGVDALHFDVMDSIFVPNLAVGPQVYQSIRQHSALPCDVHLMVTRPATVIPLYEGAEWITVHAESDPSLSALAARRYPPARLEAGRGAQSGDSPIGSGMGHRSGRACAGHDREPRLCRPAVHPGYGAQGRSVVRAPGASRSQRRARRRRRQHPCRHGAPT